MKKIIRLTESELTNIVKRVIEESKNTHSKKKILGMSKDELKELYGELEIKGEYLGKKGTFHHFKKTSLGDVVCSFSTDDSTPSGLKRRTQAIKVKSDDVKFKNNINESEEDGFDSSDDCEKLFSTMEYVFNDFMDFVKTSPEEQSPEDMYDDLQSELGGILYQAEEMECEDIQDLEIMYNDCLREFAEYVELF